MAIMLLMSYQEPVSSGTLQGKEFRDCHDPITPLNASSVGCRNYHDALMGHYSDVDGRGNLGQIAMKRLRIEVRIE
jgi:hypothetical protein